ncbi:MAG: zinc ribbon domain-containing protein [Clostridia bacterium]|nr:zinc ribbon domain-containing protein [Oscillospiraceae bacterium]MBO5126196.1 zinc ribbon domain-containing protein [Clostridia bacterium]MBQ7931033.1 zinc ribbon domain-containing protein [Clostridia bacterium]
MTRESRFRNLEQFGFGPNVMKKTKICAKCGQIAKTGTFFCRRCGAFLPRETLYDRYRRQHACCTGCGTVLTKDAKYCPHCGMRTRLDTAGK